MHTYIHTTHTHMYLILHIHIYPPTLPTPPLQLPHAQSRTEESPSSHDSASSPRELETKADSAGLAHTEGGIPSLSGDSRDRYSALFFYWVIFFFEAGFWYYWVLGVAGLGFRV